MRNAREDAKPKHSAEIEAWGLCLITSGGDKNQCLKLAKALMFDEPVVVASFFMASVRSFSRLRNFEVRR